MFGWLFGDPWQEEPLLDRKTRKRRRGPSWQAFWLAVAGALIAGIVIGICIQEAQLAHAGLL
jgi:hypothetical protein